MGKIQPLVIKSSILQFDFYKQEISRLEIIYIIFINNSILFIKNKTSSFLVMQLMLQEVIMKLELCPIFFFREKDKVL